MANYPPSYYQGVGYPQQSFYPQTYQTQYMQPQPMPMISGRMVTSLEEARAVQVDFTGGITVCPDIGHDVIYVKMFDRNTGAAPVVEYRRADSKTAEDRLDKMQRQLDALLQLLNEPVTAKHGKEADSLD